MVFVIWFGAALQVVAPTVRVLGGPRLPVLGSLAIYYALRHRRGQALWAGLLAGLIQDALGMLPLGYSAFCYVLAAEVVMRVRGQVYVGRWSTHAVIGALVHGGTAAVLWFLLRLTRALEISVFMGGLRVASTALVGALITPLVCWLAGRMEAQMGLIQEESMS